MRIKTLPEDFIVKEIPSALPIGQGDYIWCTLKKTNWDFLKLIREISRLLQISRSKIGFAGTKDKAAVTYQTISFFGVGMQKLKSLGIRDVELSDFEYNQRPIKLGELKGNWFSITMRDLESKYGKEFLVKRIAEIKKRGVLNLFDSQRFGKRSITHLVGKEILENNIPGAVYLYLTKTNKDERKEVRDARKALEETEDFGEALKLFPHDCKWEIAILNHLVSNPDDYTGALRSLPKTLRMMFIHAYQSYIWNMAVKEISKTHKKNIDIPLVGFGTKLENSDIDKTIKRILNKEKVNLENFKIASMSELTSSGSKRPLYVYPEKLNYRLEKDELNKGKNKAIVEFEIPKGSYGTRVIKEIFS